MTTPAGNAPRAPYSLAPNSFPLPALAGSIGRAPLGGPREIALACFVVGRLVHDAAYEADLLTGDQRRIRAQGTRQWLGSAALPGGIRSALVRLADSTVSMDSNAVRAALESVMTVTANQLDSGARLELGRLAQAVVK
ncbi:MAG TPA: hypothetical protein VJ867_10850 [Gemmatimonadaceae bacterium]|nr:hypothetical protein [Gemmatimonadaceae bacterium]